MSPLQLLDDLIDIIEFITNFPRVGRVYAEVPFTFMACVMVANISESPDGPGPIFGTILRIDLGLTLGWQRSSR